MIKGFCTIIGATDPLGRPIPLRQLVDRGWVRPCRAPAGWGIGPDELPIGKNLWLDQGRQYIAFAMGFRAPISNYVIQNWGVGTGITPETVTDVALQSPITLSNSLQTKPIDSIDFPAPFIAQVQFTLGSSDANGYLVTEFGLFSGDQTLLAHWVVPGVNKSSDWSPTFCHRCWF